MSRRKGIDALVFTGIVLTVGLAVGGAWWSHRGDVQASGAEPGQSSPTYVVTHDEESGAMNTPTPAPSADTFTPTGENGLAPEGAIPVEGDETLSIPASSAVSAEDAIAASRIARAFVTTAWDINPSDPSPWTAFLTAVHRYGTNDLQAEYDAKDTDPTSPTLLGPWTGNEKTTSRFRAQTNLTNPTDPTAENREDIYHVTVWYIPMIGDTTTPGLTPMGERAPAQLTMTRHNDEWKVSEPPAAVPPWVTYYLDNAPG